MTTALRKYDRRCACPKCGRGPRTHKELKWFMDILAVGPRMKSDYVPIAPHDETYHRGSWWGCWKAGCPGRKLKRRERREHFYRHCAACGVGWIETPLDDRIEAWEHAARRLATLAETGRPYNKMKDWPYIQHELRELVAWKAYWCMMKAVRIWRGED